MSQYRSPRKKPRDDFEFINGFPGFHLENMAKPPFRFQKMIFEDKIGLPDAGFADAGAFLERPITLQIAVARKRLTAMGFKGA